MREWVSQGGIGLRYSVSLFDCVFLLAALRPEFILQLFNRWEASLEVGGKRLGEPILGDTDRRFRIPERVFRDHFILSFTDDQSNTWLVIRVPQQIVYGSKIEVHLAREFRCECSRLQIDNHERAKCQMVEEQVDIKILIPYFKVVLATDKSEPTPSSSRKLRRWSNKPCSSSRSRKSSASMRKSNV